MSLSLIFPIFDSSKEWPSFFGSLDNGNFYSSHSDSFILSPGLQQELESIFKSSGLSDGTLEITPLYSPDYIDNFRLKLLNIFSSVINYDDNSKNEIINIFGFTQSDVNFNSKYSDEDWFSKIWNYNDIISNIHQTFINGEIPFKLFSTVINFQPFNFGDVSAKEKIEKMLKSIDTDPIIEHRKVELKRLLADLKRTYDFLLENNANYYSYKELRKELGGLYFDEFYLQILYRNDFLNLVEKTQQGEYRIRIVDYAKLYNAIPLPSIQLNALKKSYSSFIKSDQSLKILLEIQQRILDMQMSGEIPLYLFFFDLQLAELNAFWTNLVMLYFELNKDDSGFKFFSTLRSVQKSANRKTLASYNSSMEKFVQNLKNVDDSKVNANYIALTLINDPEYIKEVVKLHEKKYDSLKDKENALDSFAAKFLKNPYSNIIQSVVKSLKTLKSSSYRENFLTYFPIPIPYWESKLTGNNNVLPEELPIEKELFRKSIATFKLHSRDVEWLDSADELELSEEDEAIEKEKTTPFSRRI